MDRVGADAASPGRQWPDEAGTPASWGQRLRRYRARGGLTQEELAERSGYSTDYISKLERDQRQPPVAAIDRLADVLGLDSGERAGLHAVRGQQRAAGSRTDVNGPVGRDREMAEIRGLLAGAGPPVLLLSGEPGIGKTRLLTEAAAAATRSGWRVVQGGCQRWAQDPYAPLADALASSIRGLTADDRKAALYDGGRLARIVLELDVEGEAMGQTPAPLAPAQERRLLFAAVARYLGAVAGEAGTLLVLDDLQWAGPDALDLLATLVTSSQTPPIRIVGAYRDSEGAADAPLAGLVADLARSSLVQVLPLDPLSQEAATRLLTQLVPADDERRLALLPAIVRRAGGVPFFLVSYVEDLRVHGGAEARLELPWTVAQVVRQRVMVLPDTIQELLGMAAVIGRIVPRPLLGRLSGLPEDDVLTSLETAAAARLLEEDGEGDYRFTHDLIRETIESDLSAGRRQILHRRIGEILEQDDRASVESLAFHFALGDDTAKAIVSLERAGDDAQQRYAHAAAADFFGQAIARLAGVGRGQEAAALEEKRGAALHRAGRYDEAIAALERALEIFQAACDEEAVHRVTGRLAESHFRRGTGRDMLDHVVALAEDGTSNGTNGGSHGGIALREGLARLLFGQGAFKQMLRTGRSLSRIGRVTRNTWMSELGERIEGGALIFLGHLNEGIAVLEAVVPRRLADGEPERVAEISLALNAAYLATGSLDRSEALSAEMLPLAESLNDRVIIASHALLCGAALHLRGDWEGGRPYLDLSDELFAAAGSSSLSVRLVAVRAPCLISEGRWEEARCYLDTALHLSRSIHDAHGGRAAICHLAELDLLEEQPEVAIARLAPLAEDNLAWSYAIQLLSTLAAAYLAVGDLTRAETTADRAVAEARRMEAWLNGVGALRIQGLIASQQSNHDRARSVFEEGLGRARSIPFPYGEAQMLHAYGLLERQQGDSAADGKLAEALTIFERLGATKDVERLRAATQTR